MVNKSYKHEVVKAIEAYLNETKLSANDLAHKIRQVHKKISNATISNMRNLKWDSIGHQLWEAVGAFLDVHHDDAFKWDIRETRNYSIIQKFCQSVHEDRAMMAVCGQTGLGKTIALQNYAKGRKNVYYVLVRKSMSVKEFLHEVSRSMNVQHEGSVNSFIQKISERMIQTNGLLILDDVGKRIDRLYGVLQELYDLIVDRAGIALSGTPALYHHMMKNSAQSGIKTKDTYPELMRRIGYWQKLYPPPQDFVTRVCEDFGIVDSGAINFIYRNCTNYDAIRATIQAAMKVKDEKITAVVLSDLHVGARHWEE